MVHGGQRRCCIAESELLRSLRVSVLLLLKKAYRFEHVHISAAAVALCCIIAVHYIVIFADIVINDLLASSQEYIVDIPILCYLHALIYPEGIEERRSVNFVPKRRGSVISGEHFAASLNIIRQIYFFLR